MVNYTTQNAQSHYLDIKNQKKILGREHSPTQRPQHAVPDRTLQNILCLGPPKDLIRLEVNTS